MAAATFGVEVFSTILNLLPHKDALKLGMKFEELGKQTKERMEYLIMELDKLRNSANFIYKLIVHKEKPPSRGGGSGGSGVGSRGHAAHHAGGVSNLECRVCKHMQANQQDGNCPYFLNHLSLKPVDCPNSISIRTREL